MSDEHYQFILGSNPCDICQSMQGIYPYEPHVPVHPNCDCRVESTGDSLTCGEEIRNARSQHNDSTETVTADVPLDEAVTEPTDREVDVEIGVKHESWDSELLKDAVGWSPPAGYQTLTVTFGPGPARTARVYIEVTMEEVTAAGELWDVCRREADPNDPHGFAHTVEERFIGMVGGGALARTGIASATIDDSESGGQGRDHFFYDDEEAPA